MAVWKEGSSRYLVGRLNKLESSVTGAGGQYTCYRYERQLEGGRLVIKMSQSVSGRCEGLWSAEEGDKTYTLRKGNGTLIFQLISSHAYRIKWDPLCYILVGDAHKVSLSAAPNKSRYLLIAK